MTVSKPNNSWTEGIRKKKRQIFNKQIFPKWFADVVTRWHFTPFKLQRIEVRCFAIFNAPTLFLWICTWTVYAQEMSNRELSVRDWERKRELVKVGSHSQMHNKWISIDFKDIYFVWNRLLLRKLMVFLRSTKSIHQSNRKILIIFIRLNLRNDTWTWDHTFICLDLCCTHCMRLREWETKRVRGGAPKKKIARHDMSHLCVYISKYLYIAIVLHHNKNSVLPSRDWIRTICLLYRSFVRDRERKRQPLCVIVIVFVVVFSLSFFFSCLYSMRLNLLWLCVS